MSLAAEASDGGGRRAPGCRGGRSAGSGGGGTLVAPVTSRVSLALPARTVVRAGKRVCVVAPCSSSAARDSKGRGGRLWLLRVARLLPAGRSGSGVLEPTQLSSPVARGRSADPGRHQAAGLGSPRPPASADILSEPPLGLGWSTSAQRSVAPEPSGLGPFSFGRNRKVLRPGGQPPVPGHCCGANTAVRIWGPGVSTSGCGTKLEITGLDPPLKIAATSVPLSFVRIVFLALHVAKELNGYRDKWGTV